MAVNPDTLVIWHNPRCSKSRQALAYLQDRGLTPEVRLYLKDPPSADEIRAMLTALDLPPAALLRKEGAALKSESDAAIIALAGDSAMTSWLVISTMPRRLRSARPRNTATMTTWPPVRSLQ